MVNHRVRLFRWFYLSSACILTAQVAIGCGNDSTAGSERVTPTIVAAKMVDEGVEVTYRAPGADGGDWPVLRISVRETEGSLPAWSEDVRPVEEEGTLVVPMEVQPHRDIVVYGSAVYEDGERVHLAEKGLRS